MSIIEPSPEPRTAGPEPAAPASPPPEVDEPEAAEIEPETFDRKYVEDLRQESQRYREQLREQEAVWEDWSDPDERAAMQEFVRLSKRAERGDEEAAARLAELIGEPEAPAEEPLTLEAIREEARREAREAAQAIVDERDQARQQADAITGINARIEQLGYKLGSEEHILLLRYANQLDTAQYPDVIAEADNQLKAYRQRTVEEYLARKEADTDGSLRQPFGGGSAPSTAANPAKPWEGTGKDPWTWARDSFHDRQEAAR